MNKREIMEQRSAAQAQAEAEWAAMTPGEKSREAEKYYKKEYGSRKSRAAAHPEAKGAAAKKKAKQKAAKAARKKGRR